MLHNRSLQVSSCNLYSVIDYYLFILFLCQSLKECPPTQECDLLKVSTSMKQPFPVDSAHLMNRQSQKMHLTRTSRLADETMFNWGWRSVDLSPDFGRANLLELFAVFLMAFNRLSMTTGLHCYFQPIEQRRFRCMCVCVCAPRYSF